jgi:gamma-glutamylcyclotransferase (GGCT)/AIG2-like uncharacterized protein YtfP
VADAHNESEVGPAALFAYGTLQPGRLRWPFLEPYAVGHRAAVVAGAMYDSGYGWPVARFGDGPGIPGTLVALDPGRLVEALVVLDEVEATATDVLTRILVTTHDGAPAWAYHCADIPAGAVPIAVWPPVDER